MKRRRWLYLGVVALLLAISIFIVRSLFWPLIGWIKGDAFYRGMPTTWWAKEMEESAVGPWQGFVGTVTIEAHIRQPSFLESIYNYCTGTATRLEVLEEPFPLLSGDPDAIPVLLDLLWMSSASSTTSEAEWWDMELHLVVVSGLRKTRDGTFAIRVWDRVTADDKPKVSRTEGLRRIKDYCQRLVDSDPNSVEGSDAKELLRRLR